jgi:hypothetical protein
MLYYYAHTGHKVGLERARRGLALMKKLAVHNVEMRMLVNDFRAGVALKDEQGLSEYITIETIQDIDAVAQMGDSVIIDSDEDDHGRLVKYISDFKQVWRFAHDEKDKSVHEEVLFRPSCREEVCEEAVIIDDIYLKTHKKEERILFFLGDHDHDKTILGNEIFFKAFDMELLLGHYFFVKYENNLAKLFSVLHEAEVYPELIYGSSTIVTASAQTALEARLSGAKVIFLQLNDIALYPLSLLENVGIEVVEGFDISGLKKALETVSVETSNNIKVFNESSLLKKL